MQTKELTIVFLLKDNQILLAMKKRGFGEGKFNGVGGKVVSGETIEQAAVREAIEEVNVKPINLEEKAVLDFCYPDEAGEITTHQVTVFITYYWEGEISESEEMKPQWFDLDKIPYQDMWEDDPYWLSKVLEGKQITGKFMFDKDKKLQTFEIREI